MTWIQPDNPSCQQGFFVANISRYLQGQFQRYSGGNSLKKIFEKTVNILRTHPILSFDSLTPQIKSYAQAYADDKSPNVSPPHSD